MDCQAEFPCNKTEGKKRNPNWAEGEVYCLCNFVVGNHERLFGNKGHCTQTVEERKRKCWAECAQLLKSSVGGKERKWDDIKRKWFDLKVRANKYAAKKNKTGGGAFSLNPIFEGVLQAQSPQVIEGVVGKDFEAGLSSSQETDDGTAISVLSAMVVPTPETQPSTSATATTVKKTTAINRMKKRFSAFEEECLSIKRERLEVEKKRLLLQEREVCAVEKLQKILENHFDKEC